MSHVDEGLLNALLDDELDQRKATDVREHLNRCDACRALFAVARQQRERASAILQEADPGLATPPFEHVLERATAASKRHKAARLSRFQSVALAATVVLAVAVGWYARGRVSTPQQARESGAFSDTAAQPMAMAERDEAAPPPETLEERQQPVPRSLEQETKVVPSAPPAAEPADMPREREAPPPAAAGQAKMRDGALDSFARAVTAREAAIDQISVATPLADSAVAIRGIRGTWARADRSSAQAFIGGQIAMVEGLPVLSYEVRTSDDGRRLTRITQRLASGESVSIVQGRSAEPAEVARRGDRARQENVVAPRGAVTALTDIRGEYLVTIQAAVTADSLRALLRMVK